eukprot:Pompholyxophrys_punicea_v1_NODE_1303_length_801_cov_2.495979.p1 type:complete len:102 gc:universal NODE_1303_length_801_cov_2.495979:241-546(+)
MRICKEMYKEMDQSFSTLAQLHDLDTPEMEKKCANLVKKYPCDLGLNDFTSECLSLKTYTGQFKPGSSSTNSSTLITKMNVAWQRLSCEFFIFFRFASLII